MVDPQVFKMQQDESENVLKNVIDNLDTDTCQTLQKAFQLTACENSRSVAVFNRQTIAKRRSLYQTGGPCIFQHRAPQAIHAKLGEDGSEMLDAS